MAKDNIQFIEPDEYRSGEEVPFSLVIARHLMNLNVARLQGHIKKYIDGVDALMLCCWHLIHKSKKTKAALEKIEEKFDERISREFNDNPDPEMKKQKTKDYFSTKQRDNEFLKAREIHKEIMIVLYKEGEITEFFEG